MSAPPRLLPAVMAAFSPLAEGDGDVATAAFAEACTSALPLFDCLGSVFYFAKTELETKRASLVAVQASRPTLASVVAADVATNTATAKGSPTRNLHRIASSLAFLADLLSALASDPSAPLRPTAADAYGRTLAAAHNGLLRAGVRASLYLLPDRATFLASAGEPTDHDARSSADAAALARVLSNVVARVEALFAAAGVKMPVSDVRWLPSGGATVAAG